MAAFAASLMTRCSEPGVRPGRAGNFSLTRQRKVTKRGALMQSALERDQALAMLGVRHAPKRPAALSLLSL